MLQTVARNVAKLHVLFLLHDFTKYTFVSGFLRDLFHHVYLEICAVKHGRPEEINFRFWRMVKHYMS